jgi:His/Glu/Gln/Arg/opine family amino acid ABC transporter permease subunit
MDNFDFGVVLVWMPMLIKGLGVTCFYTAISLILSLVIGLIVAVLQITNSRLLRLAARLYVDAIRGTPLLVQLFILYYGLPSLGIDLSAPTAAFLGLGVNSGAYMAEIFRAGLEAVPRPHVQAARSLGMSYFQTLRRVVLPQALTLVLPPITNETINLVKSTSLISTIAIGELLRAGQLAVSITFAPVEIYLVVALLYLLINSLLSQAVRYLEERTGGRTRREMRRTIQEVGV